MTTDWRCHVFVNCNHRFWWQKPFITRRYLPTTQWTFLWHSPIYFKVITKKIYSLWLCLQSTRALAGTHHSNYPTLQQRCYNRPTHKTVRIFPPFFFIFTTPLFHFTILLLTFTHLFLLKHTSFAAPMKITFALAALVTMVSTTFAAVPAPAPANSGIRYEHTLLSFSLLLQQPTCANKNYHLIQLCSNPPFSPSKKTFSQSASVLTPLADLLPWRDGRSTPEESPIPSRANWFPGKSTSRTDTATLSPTNSSLEAKAITSPASRVTRCGRSSTKNPYGALPWRSKEKSTSGTRLVIANMTPRPS